MSLEKKSIQEAVVTAPYVDAILLDSGNPSLAIKELGGYRTHTQLVSEQAYL
jgi:phosphoribosylanthranilate isomerase